MGQVGLAECKQVVSLVLEPAEDDHWVVGVAGTGTEPFSCDIANLGSLITKFQHEHIQGFVARTIPSPCHAEQLANGDIPLFPECSDAGDDPAGSVDHPFDDLNGAWVAVSDSPDDPAGELRVAL